jgi:hypothetical protein
MRELELPTHPLTGLRAIGMVAGRPVWPALGGAEDTTDDPDGDADTTGADDAETDATGEDDTKDPAAEAALGDAGKKALDAMKAKWRAERDRSRKLEQDLAAAKKPPADAGAKPDLEAMREQARDEARGESLRERVLDKIEAKAARLFSNPEDARLFLADKADDFIDGKTVDVEAIGEALADLLKERPYLGVTQGDAKRFKGTVDGGPRGEAGKPQLTKADVEKLARDGKHAEIEQARVNGQLDTLLGIT